MVITIIITLSVENYATPLYPPLKIIDERQIFSLKSIGLKWKQIASLIGVSESTFRERRKSFDDEILTYTLINDYELDIDIIDILNRPRVKKKCGESHGIKSAAGKRLSKLQGERDKQLYN